MAKSLTKRVFDVRIYADPPGFTMQGALAKMSLFWQPEWKGNFVMTGGEVRDDVIHAVIEYTVRGGAPYDVRNRVGRLLFGRPATSLEVEATQISMERIG
ncbi:MAG: hypothetical protein JWM76_905 [Pseudonocardiales bacterium]|nr:hypothetical protein [Pseudonocardiales bacterium]